MMQNKEWIPLNEYLAHKLIFFESWSVARPPRVLPWLLAMELEWFLVYSCTG